MGPQQRRTRLEGDLPSIDGERGGRSVHDQRNDPRGGNGSGQDVRRAVRVLQEEGPIDGPHRFVRHGDEQGLVSRRGRGAIRRMLEEGKKQILLNLAGVGYIDSSGIGELVSSYTAINKEGGQLKLLSLTQKLQDLLTITKLLTVFDSYDNEADALSNFK